MPRAPAKRAASGAAGETQPKKAKTTKAASSAASTSPSAASSASKPAAPPASKRWSKVSASRNADADFKLAIRDPARANAFMCICKPPFVDGDDDSDEDEGDDEEDDEDGSDEEGSDEVNSDDEINGEDTPKKSRTPTKPKCDGGKTCLCNKPASEHPEHEWVVTYGGYRKWAAQLSMAAVRCPDTFDMYTYNDHEAYGILEVMQNLMLDWDEATTWQEQWFVCEGLALFVLGQGQQFYMIDDGEQADVVALLIGRLFLTMLARLEAQGLLVKDSEVKNLGLIMTLYIKLARDMRSGSLLEEDKKESISKPSRFNWTPSRFDEYINVYAIKYEITLCGIKDLDRLTVDFDTDLELPTGAETFWGWARVWKPYTKRYANIPPMGYGRTMIGGDNYDITSWPKALRKKYNFAGVDPFSKKDLDALAEGMVMQMM